MEISVTFSNQPDTKESLQVLKKVGEGKFAVFHAYCPSQKANYALKIFPKDAFGAAQYKKETSFAHLSHSNIIKQFPATIAGSEEDGSYYTVLTEFAKNGDFFDFIIYGGSLLEILIRTYFHQLIAGLEYMHSQGACHLDLKLENLMLSSDFDLKIIDFDQAQPLTDKKLSSAGTEGFRAPEVLDESCENFCAADVYSAGVILYAFRTQEYPFAEVNNGRQTTLKQYPVFLKNNKSFWELRASQKGDETFFSESFKELINGMLQADVAKRFTIQDIKKSEWYNGPVLDAKSLKTEAKKHQNSMSTNKNEFSY
jgi:serine/threonine protein kinase